MKVVEADDIADMIKEVGEATNGLRPVNINSSPNIVLPALMNVPINPTTKIPITKDVNFLASRLIYFPLTLLVLFLLINLAELKNVRIMTKPKYPPIMHPSL